ncbi:Cys-Gln thioester bond-forming surface protein [Kitasatospora sp. MAP5-34]|uniref:Cys-Gln thioester bond-forming surface protein n=1 Tax=Kitasatospora sp. MAP5-34 TaxID=3035102 RepID=UPI00247482AD|nr:Cys-Gln thioester bond-forming surface protein [Kitasatospora sp. MAP5-34]
MLTSTLLVGGGLMTAGSASATTPGGSGVTAHLLPGLSHGQPVTIDAPGHQEFGQAGLFAIQASDGSNLPVYCIDLLNGTRDNARYQETDWGSSSLAGAAGPKIKWILEHSYPNVSPGQLATDASAKGTQLDGLTADEAAAGTQVAVWSFSDPNVPVHQQDAKAEQLTQYLIDQAQGATDGEPKASLTLNPGSVSGKSGDRLGPITVDTTAAHVDLGLDPVAAKAGLVLTDAAGNVVKSVKGGDAIFAKAPAGAAPGTGTITATSSVEIPVGRVFTGADEDGNHSQTLILAGAKSVSVSATATVTWAPTGPIPAVTAKVDCAHGAVVVTVTNNGDQDFVFTLAGQTVTVKPKGTQSIPVKVAEGQKYDIVVTGPNGFKQEFKSVLNCKTTSSTGTPTSSPTPGTGHSATPSPSATGTPGGGLAFTGGGGETPLLAGIAGALVIAGGGAVFALRRRGRHSRTSG